MQISARNTLKGRVKHIAPGAVNTEVTVELPGGAEVLARVESAGLPFHRDARDLRGQRRAAAYQDIVVVAELPGLRSVLFAGEPHQLGAETHEFIDRLPEKYETSAAW